MYIAKSVFLKPMRPANLWTMEYAEPKFDALNSNKQYMAQHTQQKQQQPKLSGIFFIQGCAP